LEFVQLVFYFQCCPCRCRSYPPYRRSIIPCLVWHSLYNMSR